MRRLLLLLPLLAAAIALLLWWSSGDPVLPTAPRSGPATTDTDPTATAASPAPATPPTPTATTLRDLATPTDPTAALRAATDTALTGRVVTPTGEPVPGIDVQLLRIAADAALPFGLELFTQTPPNVDLVVASSRTAADGRFRLHSIPPRGLAALRLAFAEPSSAPARFRSGQNTYHPVQASPAPGETADLGDVVLKVGGTLQGRVVGDDGPIAGATIRAARLPPLPFAAVPIERFRPDGALIVLAGGQERVVEFPAWVARVVEALPIAQATSGADGAFVVYGVDPGEDVVAVTAPRFTSLLRQNVHVDAGATTGLGELRLGEGCSPTVLVADAAGAPIADAEVLIAPCSVGVPVHVAEPAGRTGADGKVHAEGLPCGRAIAAARVRGGGWHLSEPGSADGTLRVVVPGRLGLLLTVTDAAGRGLPAARVRATQGTANAGAVEFALFGFGRTMELDAHLERRPDGKLWLHDLDAGPWTFVVDAAGFAPLSLDVDLKENAERTVALQPASPLRVRTIDERGEPVAGAVLHLQARGGSRNERIVEVPLPVGRTGADGWTTIAHLPTAVSKLTASHPRHGQVHTTLEGRPAEVVLQFAAAGAIRGVLTDGGRVPALGRWVLVLERRYGDAPGEQRGAMPDLPLLTLPDPEGRFGFAALQPGKYRVTAQDAMTDVSTVAGAMAYAARRDQILPYNKAEVELHGGETANVQLDALLDPTAYTGPGAVVRGTVTENGAPAAGAVVVGASKQPDRRVTSRVDRGGGFDLGRMPAGALRVVVVPQEVAESRLKENVFSHHFARDLVVVDGSPMELQIDIATGGVFGEVRDRAGVVVEDCRLVLYDRGGGGRSSSLRVEHSDARGAFAFPDVPEGVYEVRAEKAGAGKVTVPDVRVVAGGSVGPVAVVLVPMVTVAGRVETPAGTRAEVQLVPPGGGDPYRAGTEPGGAFRIDGVPLGGYEAKVRAPAGTPWRAAGTVTVGEGGVRDLVLRAGG